MPVSLKGLASRLGFAKGQTVYPTEGFGPKSRIINFRLKDDGELLAILQFDNPDENGRTTQEYPVKELKKEGDVKKGGGGRRSIRRRSSGGARRKKRSSLKKSLSNSLSSMSNFLSPKKGKKSKRGKTVKRSKGKKSKGKKSKKSLNPYMKALKKARDSDAPSFTYNGKTYYQKTTKTGMKIYAAR